jgi:DNA-binding transcriptional regulator YiaG
MINPTTTEIKAKRLELGLTQTEAGKLVGAKIRSWQDWESGARNMPSAKWELFLIKTGENNGR